MVSLAAVPGLELVHILLSLTPEVGITSICYTSCYTLLFKMVDLLACMKLLFSLGGFVVRSTVRMLLSQ